MPVRDPNDPNPPSRKTSLPDLKDLKDFKVLKVLKVLNPPHVIKAFIASPKTFNRSGSFSRTSAVRANSTTLGLSSAAARHYVPLATTFYDN